MKTRLNLLLAGIVAVFCCSIGNAQIIYSNNFSLGTGVDISNTPPTVANSYAGGTNTARWVDLYGALNPSPGGVLLDNGVNLCPNGDYWNLPFIPQPGHIYLLTVNMTFTNGTSAQPEIGFSSNATNYVTDGRFNGSIGGFNWMALAYGSGNVQYFAIKTSTTIFSSNGIFPAATPSTNTVQILLDTEGALWSAAGYVNGVEMGKLYTYSANPTTIQSVGISENSAPNPPSMVQFNSLTLTTTLQPFIVQQPTASQTLSSGLPYTNTVAVMADTNSGPLSYQWYANGAPLVNGGPVSGADTNVLVINPTSTADQFTNYYVIVTNNYGSATSSLASLTILTNPVVTAPASPSNSITLFGGTGGYVGSSPTFSVSAVGAPPLTYLWLTNGVVVGGATGNSFEFTNLQATGPTSFACIVSNSFGEVTNTWYATYIATPTAAYPQSVLGDLPHDFWRLNEPDDGNFNEGVTCHDYQSGNNGIYTNVILGDPGYDSLEPTETAMSVANSIGIPSCVKQIVNVDLAATMTNGVNAAFSVEAWANTIVANGSSGGAPVVSQGTLGASSFFLGADTNSSAHNYQFYVRNAAGTLYSADSTILATDGNWHYLVGVCDEAKGNISLYIDGRLAASASIPANSGIFESGRPVAIGAGIRPTSSDYDVPLTGDIADVAIYDHALSPGQVIAHYAAAGNPVPVSFVPPMPPTNVAYQANQTVTIPATVSGSEPIGYYWTNVTVGGVLGSGQTNASGSLDATLIIPNVSTSLSGDQLELVVTNDNSSTNWSVTLFSPPSPITLDYSNPILYSNNFNGGTWSIAGLAPTAANVLVGGTNSVWVDSLGTNDVGVMQANGTPTSTLQDSWTLPFTPHAGYIYTLSATETFLGAPNNWVALGFCQNIVTNGTVGGTGKINGGATSPNGVDWILWQQNGSVQYLPSASLGGVNLANGATATAGNVSHTVQIILDTTGTQWKCYAVIDGHTTSTGTYPSIPVIHGIVIAQNSSGAANQNIQWNTVKLTQVAPGGVSPYVYNSVPPTNVTLLADASLSIPVTAFGSAPFGYYWSNTNTAAVLASGTTSDMAPLSANLSVADVPSSWNGNTLELIVTNAYGTNISLVALTVGNPINTSPTNIVATTTNNNLYLTWPADHTGWTLQTQTNALSAGIGTNWVDISGSTLTNQIVVPINPANGSVFYRMILK